LFEVASTLNKVLVREFYRLNAGFFLVVITIAFGFMSGVEHRALAQFFISSSLLLTIPIIIWALYGIKIIHFNHQHIRRSENTFLFELALLTPSRRFAGLLTITSGQLLPAFAYGSFLITMAIASNRAVAATEAFAGLIAILLWTTSALYYQLDHPAREVKTSFLKKFLDYRFTKTIVQYYIGWMIRREPAILLGTKVFSGLLLFGVAQLYRAEEYDWRLMALGCTIAFAGNFAVISQLHRFENFHFVLLRNLPISLVKRLQILAAVLLIFSIPEFAVLGKYFPENLGWQIYLVLVVYSISVIVLFYSLLFLQSVDEKKFSSLIFVFMLLWIILILFSVPALALALGNLTAGLWIYHRRYYLFEYASAGDRKSHP
jgi:hypothetical protein